MLPILAALALQVTPADTVRPAASGMPADTPQVALDSATLAGAYLDSGARELVERARARRRTVDRSIREYETIVRERVSMGVRAGWLERTAYRRDAAARIHWRRDDPIRIEALGAREAAPIAQSGVEVPDLDGFMGGAAFDPADGERLLDWGDNDFVRHPLARGSERYYRFRSGDTIAVRLPDGPTVRLIELEVLPRYGSPRIIRGSFWLDADSDGIVRAGFRLSRDINTGEWELDFETDVVQDSAGTDTVRTITLEVETGVDSSPAADEDASSEPDGMGFLGRTAIRLGVAMVPDIRAHVRYVTIDYGLWDRRWWLPRLIAFEGAAEIAGVEMPLRYERRYGAYEVAADSTPDEAPRVAAAAPDSADAEREVIVVVPDDTASLLTSEYLPSDALSTDRWLVDDAELDGLLDDVFDDGAGAPWRFGWSSIDWDPLVRYNRVEALSLGMGAEADLGPVEVSGTARIGTGDVEPRGTLSFIRRGVDARHELTGYRRLQTMDPRAKAFSNVASASALLFGYDEPDYYDALGVSLTGRPPAAASPWYEWRLYAQREDAVRKETDFSVARLFDDGERFRANAAAAEAVQYGAALALRSWRGRDSGGFRWGGALRLDAAAGDYEYVRPSLLLRTTVPIPGPFAGTLEAEAGAVWGDPALQHLHRVGGTASVRGYHGSQLVGESSWRMRAELATRMPAARLILFSDAGWAGPFDAFGAGDPLASAGIGAGFLDGFVRIDVARALVAPTGWRMAVYVDGPL